VEQGISGADGFVAGLRLLEARVEQPYFEDRIIRRAAQVIVLADADKLGCSRQQYWTALERDWRLSKSRVLGEECLTPFSAWW